MKKKFCICLILVAMMALLVCPIVVLAAERMEYQELRLTTVRTEKIDVPGYMAAGGGWLAEIIARLVESGEPAVVFKDQATAALEVTFVDGILGSNWNLNGGATLFNEEPANFIWGFKYTGWTGKSEEGGIWLIFSKFQPAVYNEQGRWYPGLAYYWKVQL